MVAALERQDPGTARGQLGGLERDLDGFRPGRGQDTPGVFPWRQAGQPLQELELELGRVHIPHPVNEAAGLLLEGGPDAWMCMTRHGDTEGTGEVHIYVAVHVSDVGA